MIRVALVKANATNKGGLEKYTGRIKTAFEAKNCEVSLITSKSQHLFSFQKVAAFDRYCSSYFQHHSHDVILGLDRIRHQTHLRAGNGVHRAYLNMRRELEGGWKGFTFSLNPLHHTLLKIEKESFEDPQLKRIFTNSHMVEQQILSFYRTDPKKIQVIHNGVEWEEMREDFEGWPEISMVKKKDSRFQLLFIGHNFLRKGLKRLLDALSALKTKDFHLSVVGWDKNAFKFKAYAQKLGLCQQVTFYGAQTSMRSFYQIADCLVIPSHYDPFANVTVEALAMGLFVISSNTNGGHEILKPKTGYVFTNQHQLVSALELTLNHPKTWDSSLQIRNSVRHLDFSEQLKKLCDSCLT